MTEKKQITNEEEQCCGLVMPISSIDGCNEQHWIDVMGIITESIESAGFTAKLVSAADDVGIIQKRIIQNLYENPIVVCDVSGKNPNVMFELGMRLAFDKPTIIIKDDQTSYSFDTSPIEHLEYPRDLRFTKIVSFKEELKDKIKATYKRSIEDTEYTTFLKHFGTFTVSKLDSKELSKEDYIIAELEDLKKIVIQQELNQRKIARVSTGSWWRGPIDNDNPNITQEKANIIKKRIEKFLLESKENMDLEDIDSDEYKDWVFSKISSSKQFEKNQPHSKQFREIFDAIYHSCLRDFTNKQLASKHNSEK